MTEDRNPKTRDIYGTGMSQCFQTCKCGMCKRLKINGWADKKLKKLRDIIKEGE